MQPQPSDAVAKALLFANGLRKNVATVGRRWAAWPGGANHVARIIATIDRIAHDVRATPPRDDAATAAAIGELRAILEWTTYQTGALATARALMVARRTRSFVERFDLLDPDATPVATLEAAEDALIDNVRTRNGYMTTIAGLHPRLGLPPPLVSAESLVPRPRAKPGRLALVQRLKRAAEEQAGSNGRARG
jgi:hypothetical protein